MTKRSEPVLLGWRAGQDRLGQCQWQRDYSALEEFIDSGANHLSERDRLETGHASKRRPRHRRANILRSPNSPFD